MGISSAILGGNGITLLSQATGYGMVIGFSVLFAILIVAAVRIQKLYLQEDSGKSEMFMVANRSVGTGLTASAVFSSWVWINETVFSCVVCYTYGISAPMWFATGVSFQVALMGTFGVLTKLRVPYAHTSLEFLRQRYFIIHHFFFTLLNLINNVS
jgi:Na+/proline symporter